VVARDLGGQLADALRDAILGNQDAVDVAVHPITVSDDRFTEKARRAR
jgi:hypothetical protein